MPKNISISFSGIITIYYLFNRLNRNTASRVTGFFTSRSILIWVFTVCQGTCLNVSRINWTQEEIPSLREILSTRSGSVRVGFF